MFKMPALADFDWSKVPEQRRAQRDALIPQSHRLPEKYLASVSDTSKTIKAAEESGLFTGKELEMLNSEPEDILQKYRTKEWTAIEVAEAFCKSASVAQQLTNCLTEIFYETGLARARELDAHFEKTGELVGPFHGIPISVKDNFNIPGLPSSVGFVAHALEPMTTEAALITILKGLGAVLYCKTNVPTAMMMAETDNNVWGYTTNPYKKTLTAGGSSGGEAALVAMRGSVFGVGTDIGGSIRIPGSFNHLYSLRPSFGRFPTYGARSGMPGQEAVNSVNGPLARTLKTMKYYCRSVLSEGPYAPWNHDPKAIPVPYRSITLPKKLKIGVVYDDNVVRPHPPVERALALVVFALRTAGHTVIPYNPGKLHEEGYLLMKRMFLADGGRHIADVIKASGESWFDAMQWYKDAAADPETDLRTRDMWILQSERTGYMKRYLDHWKAAGVDALLSPATPYAAAQRGKMKYVGYTGVWNVLDYSAATFPVLFADKNIDKRDEGYKPMNEIDEEIWRNYDPEVYHGAPTGLQLTTGKFEEEKCIEILEVIEKAMKQQQALTHSPKL